MLNCAPVRIVSVLESVISLELDLPSPVDAEFHQVLAAVRPRWEEATSCLWIGSTLVKRLRSDAAHQRLIFRLLQTSAWPNVIRDPLPPRTCRDRKVRARETVRALNSGQHGRLRVRFHADRDQLGYRWEIVHSAG